MTDKAKKTPKFTRKSKAVKLDNHNDEPFKPLAKSKEIKRIRAKVEANPDKMAKREELEATIRMFMAEWCIDHPALTPEDYLTDIKKLDKKKQKEMFKLVPRWQWIERQSKFADEVVRRITIRGVERVAKEYDEDMKAAKKAKSKILDILDKGKIKQKIDKKRIKGIIEETISEIREPLEPNDYRSLAGAYETLQKITDRSLGITDNNREAILENIKAREKEAAEKSDEEVKKVKQLSYEDAKDLIALRREAKLNETESKKKSEK